MHSHTAQYFASTSNLATSMRPVQIEQFRSVDGIDLIHTTISHFWRLEDKYLTPVQLHARNMIVHTLSEPMSRFKGIDDAELRQIYEELVWMFVRLLDDFFFFSQVCPRLSSINFDWNNTESGCFASTTLDTTNDEEWTGSANIAFYLRAHNRCDIRGLIPLGQVFATIAHEMCHAYLSLLPCDKEQCGRIFYHKINGHGHRPGWQALFATVVDQIRRWDGPLGDCLQSKHFTYIQEHPAANDPSVRISFSPASWDAEKAAIKDMCCEGLRSSDKLDKVFKRELKDAHIEGPGLFTDENGIKIMLDIRNKWMKEVDSAIKTNNKNTMQQTRRQMARELMETEIYDPHMFNIPTWDIDQCGHPKPYRPMCLKDDKCKSIDGCDHRWYWGGKTLASFVPSADLVALVAQNSARTTTAAEDSEKDEDWDLMDDAEI